MIRQRPGGRTGGDRIDDIHRHKHKRRPHQRQSLSIRFENEKRFAETRERGHDVDYDRGSERARQARNIAHADRDARLIVWRGARSSARKRAQATASAPESRRSRPKCYVIFGEGHGPDLGQVAEGAAACTACA